MAGRGTDIMLGGNSEYLAKQEMRKQKYSESLIEEATAFNETQDEEILEARKKYKDLVKKYDDEIAEEKEKVINAGGLKIIGTERHESRRIDNQLRGRSGRQGDPGESKFFLATDDNLVKIFGGGAMGKILEMGNVPEDMPLTARPLTKIIENAQTKVEGRNFSSRKYVLSFDDVMNDQREKIYEERRQVLGETDMSDSVRNMISSTCEMIVQAYSSEFEKSSFDRSGLENEIKTTLNLDNIESLKADKIKEDKLLEEIQEKALALYEEKLKEFKELKELERIIILKVVDNKWMDHIDDMEELKNGIRLRAYGQKDPVVQYRIEGTEMFEEMINQIQLDVTKLILHIVKADNNLKRESSVTITEEGFDESDLETLHIEGELPKTNGATDRKAQPIVNAGPKVGRNDPCPCGSGKKYKNCCGKNQ